MKKQLITLAALVGGFIIGASALVALADWTQAPPNPPQNNAPAPINVGAGTPVLNLTGIQEKTNSLIIDGGLSVLGNLNIATGTNANVRGAVLTNDGNNNVVWATAPHGMVVYPGGYSRDIHNHYTWTVPDGVTTVRVRAWGGSGSFLSSGDYAESVLSVTQGTVYTLVVGVSDGSFSGTDSIFGIYTPNTGGAPGRPGTLSEIVGAIGAGNTDTTSVGQMVLSGAGRGNDNAGLIVIDY
jgi:hypothetical protein